MTDSRAAERKTTLDKDLARLGELGEATTFVSRRLVAPGLALLFMALAAFATSLITGGEMRTLVIIAAATLAAYMALNIGANDVANNVGPAVGAKVLTMGGALAIAAVFETAGALIAGREVVDTISSGIIPPDSVDPSTLVLLMLAALLSAASWINLATWIGAPVSTTHSIVGAVVGAGWAAAGLGSVSWHAMAAITASWITSPILGGVIAAAFLAFVKTAVIYRDDKIAAARFWVPLLIAVMAGAFAVYLTLIGNSAHVSGRTTALIGLAAFMLAWAAAHFHVRRLSEGMENRRQSLKTLFTVPLIISAALLSFAHGANDVANAVGPLAAIARAAGGGGPAAATPLWVMTIGALGISFGLLLFGPRLVRMVGQEITKLNPMRAFCIALSAALTVIVASWFGLPVSSTHIAVGAVFGVGFFREWYLANSVQRRRYLQRRAAERAGASDQSLAQPDDAPGKAKAGKRTAQTEIARRRLVRRAHVRTIVAAWVVTVPISASLAAVIFACLSALA
jgi:PiT family inorganic phosphate transporter